MSAHTSNSLHTERESFSSAAVGKWETVGSVLWFSMDSAWMAEWLLVAQALIAPALACHVVALKFCAERGERLVSAATVFWISMNICWMLGEIHELPELLLGAKTFSIMGFVCLIAVAAMNSRVGIFSESLKRFRRLKIQK